MMIIGLTGGIGAGKSTASKYLNELGFKTIDFDLMTRKLQEPGEPALAEMVEAFGPETLLPDGTLNRSYVGRIVFGDPKEKEKLDKIMQAHMDVNITSITDKFREAGKNVTRQTNPEDYLQKKVIFYDHPLLFEVPYNIDPAEEAWVIDVDDENRIERIKKRDPQLSEADIRKRMDCQMPQEEKLKRADVVLDNNGTKEDFINNINKALKELDERIDKK